MAKLLKLRRGTTSQHSSFTGAEGEVTVDTDKEALVVHNGSTAGGFPVARADGTGVTNFTITGELDAATLDISGNADIDGTLEADAYTVNGTALNEYIADTVGAMVTGNTENGITVTYEDGDNTLDFAVSTLNQNTSGTAGGLSGTPDITVNDVTAASLDISGNADIDGTLEADAYTVNGTALDTHIAGVTVTTATNANHVYLTDNESTNENNLIAFVENAQTSTGNHGLEMDGNLTYNPSSGTLAVPAVDSPAISATTVTTTSDVTIGGNLQVNGTTTTVNSATLNVTDKNIVMAKGAANDAAADGGGITIESGGGDKTFNWVNATDAWTSSEHIHIPDNKKIHVGGASGTTDGLEVYHNGSDSYVTNTGTGNLIIKGDDVHIQGSNGENMVNCNEDGSVDISYNNVKKFETTSGGINVTGAINVNGSPLSSAPTIDLTASGAIAANKPVIVNSSGQAVEISIPSDQTGSGVKQNSTGSSGTKCASNGAGQYIIMSADGSNIKARVATISGTTISYGTEVNVASSNASYDNFDICYVKNIDCYMIVYTKSTSDLWVKCITVSGTSITAGTESQQSNQLNTRISIANKTDSASGWCCVFWFDEAQNRLWMKSLKPNSTVTNAVGEGNTAYISGRSGTTNCHVKYNPDQQRFYGLSYYHPSTALYCESWTCAESNGGISRSGTHTISSSIIHDGGYGWMRWGLTYSPTIKKMLVSYPTGSGSGSGKIRTLTHVDGTWTTGSESTLGSNYDHMRMATHDTTQQTWLVFTNSTASGWNNNGKGPLKIRKITVNASTEAISLGSTTTLDSGEYMKNGICSGTDGMFITSVDTDDNNYPEAWFHKIGQTNMTTENFVGFSSAGYSNGQTATINVVGNTTTQSSLTPGQKYYVQGAGSVGTDPSTPSVEAGIAVSSTKLLIR